MKKLVLTLLTILTVAALKAQTDVIFYTNYGRFVVEIRDDIMPITGDNFLDLVDAEFYDGVIFHRVISGFMIQGGDPTGTGTGGPGYKIQDEFHASLSNVQKSIAMANSGPNTGGSQFFINLVDNIYLDPNHPVFGMVTENFSVVQTIGGVPTSASDRPLTDVVMDSIRRGSILTVGMDQLNSSKFSAQVFPNPIDNSSILSIDTESSSAAEIIVYDALGKIQTVRNIDLIKGNNTVPVSTLIDINNANGIYHVTISTGNDFRRINVVLN